MYFSQSLCKVSYLMCVLPPCLVQCHGLWDEDEPRSGSKTADTTHIDSDGEEKSRVRAERNSLTREASLESTHINMPRRHSHGQSSVCRQSSSTGSHVSRRSVCSRGGECAHSSIIDIVIDISCIMGFIMII